jgi:hypothetical protein
MSRLGSNLRFSSGRECRSRDGLPQRPKPAEWTIQRRRPDSNRGSRICRSLRGFRSLSEPFVIPFSTGPFTFFPLGPFRSVWDFFGRPVSKLCPCISALICRGFVPWWHCLPFRRPAGARGLRGRVSLRAPRAMRSPLPPRPFPDGSEPGADAPARHRSARRSTTR